MKKNLVKYLTHKLSQPKICVELLHKQLQVQNCNYVLATSDKHNLETKLDGIRKHESLVEKKTIFLWF